MDQTLIVGFDSAWSSRNRGAIVGVLEEAGSYTLLNICCADFDEALLEVKAWQAQYPSATTLIFVDQPTIVRNPTGQRPVEKIVSSPVGKKRGGVQPANRGKVALFGEQAPIWNFLKHARQLKDTEVYETYPVLTLMAKEWVNPDTGFLPKYNPDRMTFSLEDWKYVCKKGAELFEMISLKQISEKLKELGKLTNPRKSDQDKVDSCLCLLPGLEPKNCLMVGNTDTGYMIVPSNDALIKDLRERCKSCGEIEFPETFVQRVTLPLKANNLQ